ncbi:MAG: hypothetical protein EU532_06670 [Promethearchaeota archaeon]|nr:MAG: hypothetical protein EU532_06670 [Candidatus Lokiarchaeota archaeon]
MILPLVFIGLQNNSYSNGSENFYENRIPNAASFSKEDYQPVLDEEKQALGDLNVTELVFNEVGINLTDYIKSNYPAYENDLSLGSLKMSYLRTQFNRTVEKAQIDNLNENITDYRKITVLLNESLSIEYDGSAEGYLYYAPRLKPFIQTELWVENQSNIGLRKVNEGNYSYHNYDKINFLRFNYKQYFTDIGEDPLSFRMYLLWEFNISIDSWKLTQDLDQELLLDEDEDYVISPKFNYEFRINAKKYNQSSDVEVPADNLLINITIKLPDKELLNNIELFKNSNKITTNFLTSDNTIFIPQNLLTSNNTIIEITFSTAYQILFVDPVDETWAIDRLIEDRDTRQRIYFPDIVSGPQRIILKYVEVIEESISFDQVNSISSLFGRGVIYEEVNVTELEEDIENSLVFNENATKRAGIKITLPYMIKEEICPIIVQYETELNLRIIVTDNIRMPIAGLDVKIYYYGELYGTYISTEKNQPIGPQITDENGEILVKDVPNGNYTIKIYQNENLIKESEVSAYLEVNYVTTPIIHFPIVIIIFSSISGIFFVIGLIIYRKQKSLP